MKRVLLWLMFFLSWSVAASEASIIFGGVSYHFNRQYEYHETNPSIGIEYKGFSAIYVAQNSVEKKSIQLTYTHNFIEESWYSVGVRAGFASGYKQGDWYADGKKYVRSMDLGNGIVPYAALEVGLVTPIPNLNFMVDVNPQVVIFGFKYNL
ncbi:antimicrobial peptide resistance and lipid A acylation protein PagP [Aeromonas phage 4_4572]|nr:antimicrobial peptide resistance and lipid A acylation protein PagP [Aeromonas phage 4_4572]QEG09105.1 hypothetical protein [Aeromonas phage 4_4572]